MTSAERATCYCRLIEGAQSRMERGAALAFDRSDPRRQRAACQRMLRYIVLIRWLYARAARADAEIAAVFRASCVGKPWPYGGIDTGDETFFTLVGEFDCADIGADTDEMPVAATAPA